MKPYYDEDGITIYHGDARDVLPLVSADVLVTDPPYGVSFSGKVTKWTKGAEGYTTDDNAEIGPEVVKMALPLVERGAVFTGNRNLVRYPEPHDIGSVFCPSGAGRGPWGFTLFNPILFYGKRPTTGMYPSSLMSFETAPSGVDHPCPKPTGWLKWLIGLVSVDGEVVIDPFVGSGSTLVAARELNRRAIGIEIEEKYCEIAVQRLAQGVLEFDR